MKCKVRKANYPLNTIYTQCTKVPIRYLASAHQRTTHKQPDMALIL